MCSFLMSENEEEGVCDIPLEHDHCKARPRLTPEKAERVSGYYKE